VISPRAARPVSSDARGVSAGYDGGMIDPVAFWANVERGEPDKCWPWKGPWLKSGYGTYGGGVNKELAHRVAFKLVNGPIPPKLFVLHHCDNPPCCNPGDLFSGTHLDNMRDMSEKGRSVHGEQSNLARLTELQVLEIYDAYLNGSPQVAVASEFGISPALVGLIARGEVWQHLGLKPLDGTARKGHGKSKGESHGQAKLTANQVREIRVLASRMTQQDLATNYGVSRTLISLVINRKVWRHV
jgi:hypothetical protein